MWKYSKFRCPMRYLLRRYSSAAVQEFRDYVSTRCNILQYENYTRCIGPGCPYEDCTYYSQMNKCWELFARWDSKYYVEI